VEVFHQASGIADKDLAVPQNAIISNFSS
jgi:hypothetical protein